MTSGKVLVAQGGGPTAVINQSLVGVVLEARRQLGVERRIDVAAARVNARKAGTPRARTAAAAQARGG